jgi:1-aminocyclopropane-1-carboxylate deaminase
MKINSSPLQKVTYLASELDEIQLYVKRDDLMHSEVSGNKWRKLSRTLDYLSESKEIEGMVTFGGAFSNHLLAVAYLCSHLNIPSVGIIRGELIVPLNSTLARCAALGMSFESCSREDYRNKDSVEFLKALNSKYSNYFISPEGGADAFGVEGCRDIVDEVNLEIDFDYISIDCGTGATLAGMIRALKPNQKAIGVQVLKGVDFITAAIAEWNVELDSKNRFEVITDYHFGGYAKNSEELIEFMRSFYNETMIKLDPIYTGKQFYGIIDLIKKGYFPKGSKVVLVHSGGMQGIAGFEERYKVKIY